MDASLIAKFLEHGVLGVVCAALLIGLRTLWNRNEALQRALVETTERLQNLRVTDSQAGATQMVRTNSEMITALTNATSTLETHGEAMDRQQVAFLQLSGAIDRITAPRR